MTSNEKLFSYCQKKVLKAYLLSLGGNIFFRKVICFLFYQTACL